MRIGIVRPQSQRRSELVLCAFQVSDIQQVYAYVIVPGCFFAGVRDMLFVLACSVQAFLNQWAKVFAVRPHNMHPAALDAYLHVAVVPEIKYRVIRLEYVRRIEADINHISYLDTKAVSKLLHTIGAWNSPIVRNRSRFSAYVSDGNQSALLVVRLSTSSCTKQQNKTDALHPVVPRSLLVVWFGPIRFFV
jgi:hypothetical protein